METMISEDGMHGEFSVKELQWMKPLGVPMYAATLALSCAKDDAELGLWVRLLSEAVLLTNAEKTEHNWMMLSMMVAGAGIQSSEMVAAFLMAAKESGVIKVCGRKQKQVFDTIVKHPDALRVDKLASNWDELAEQAENWKSEQENLVKTE